MAYAQPGVVCSLLDPGVCYLGNVTLLTGEAMAKTLAERQKEHRQRLKEQGYVKISEWVTPKQRQAIRAYLRGDADLIPRESIQGQEALQDNTPKASTEETGKAWYSPKEEQLPIAEQPPHLEPGKEWYTASEAAPIIGVHKDTIGKWIKKGKVAEGYKWGFSQEKHKETWHLSREAVARLREKYNPA